MLLTAVLKSAAAALCLLLASQAGAHDTWFAPGPAATDGETVLVLATGNQFPVQESGIAAAYLQRRGCRLGDGSTAALVPVQEAAEALTLRSASRGRAAALGSSCWVQLVPFEIEIAPAKVAVYLDEINAPAPVREAWAAMQARGQPWKERYTKHARTEIGGRGAGGRACKRPAAAGMGMDALLACAAAPVRTGDPLTFQILRDGLPLAGFAIELRGDTGATWHRTDAQGRVRTLAPAPGRWLLRGTDLRVSPTDPDHWESRFITLAFDVADRPSARKASGGG